MDSPEYEEKIILEADTIFLLMKKGFPISRNVRAQWILDHLDAIINVKCSNCDNEERSELEIISVVPKNPPSSWNDSNSYEYQYRVTSSSSVIFLAHQYRIVFCLDLSPSLGTIDIQHGEIVIDEVCTATKKSLESLSEPFAVPGSKFILQPDIYVTIIVHTPFITNPAQQILVQGWLVNTENIRYLMEFIEKRLNVLEERIAQVTSVVYQQQENFRPESAGLVSGLFEERASGMNTSMTNSIGNISVISPEASFINMLRYGLLALALLPEHSCAHLVVVTDGILGTTDIHVLDTIVQQFRALTVACSFIHLGSIYHPHCANGLVSYPDLLIFIATATLGCYMTYLEQSSSIVDSERNSYHWNFLCWKLYRSESLNTHTSNYWHTGNALFYGHQQAQLLRKKLTDDKVTCSLSSLLCCRLRDGYLIKKVALRDGSLEIYFILPWKTHVFLEYLVCSTWPPKSSLTCNKIQYTITVEAPYEFLHDITCLSKKPLKSIYRQSVVSRFWATLTALTESNNMLEHFSWFPEPGRTWYNVPDTIRSGMPVFTPPAYPSAIQLSDTAYHQFGKIWQPVASLDSNQWARWMHSQRVTLILAHDRPLPKYLHQANQSGRFQCVQYRQAAAVLYAMLKNWATFVLVENHTYVQFIQKESEKPPSSFSVIRINCKTLCVVLNVAFAGGTEGSVRHAVVSDLVDKLSKLTLPNRPTEQRETSPACTIIHKALEKILIRYERMPSDMNTIVFPDGTQQISLKVAQIPGGFLTTTLSRYLYHNRWLWNVKKPVIQTVPGIVMPRLNITAISRILSTITKMRLTEGFNFAYSSAGIINMVLEVQMQGSQGECYPCIIQYIIFPPHMISNPALDRTTESEEDTDAGTGDGEGYNEDSESNGDYQIVTEIWIEPQCGQVKSLIHSTASYMESLSYHQLSSAIAQVDEECFNALLTLEHLSLLTQVDPHDNSIEFSNGCQQQASQYIPYNNCSHKISRRISVPSFSQSKYLSDELSDEGIHSKLFNFDMLNILSKCQQAELLFSMFVDSHTDENREDTNNILMECLIDEIKRLNDKELILTISESQKFTEMLFYRPREDGKPLPFSLDSGEKLKNNMRWRCFIKGINSTHIIITILPASDKDVRNLMNPISRTRKYSRERSAERIDSMSQCSSANPTINEELLTSSWTESPKRLDLNPSVRMIEFESNLSSRTTTAESTPKVERRRRISSSGIKPGLILPIYVYDCSLAFLIEVLVGKLKAPRSKDIYQNNTFTIGQQMHEDFINLKPPNDCKSTSPEPKSEDSDNLSNDQRSLLEHCKLLSLAHCHCYVVAVYKSLALQLQLSYEDMEAAVEQCEESLIEINITTYLRTVCKHLNNSFKSENSDESKELDYTNNTTCTEVQPLHNLITEKFRKIITIAFKPVPAHPEFYYYSPQYTSERLDPMEFHRSDSDDDSNFIFHSEAIDCKLDNTMGKNNVTSTATWPNTKKKNTKNTAYDSTESLISDLREDESSLKEQPLFLQLNCSVHSGSSFSSIPVKLLPTCFAEIRQRLDEYEDSNVKNLKITLDIICLNLPKDVLDVCLENDPDLRASSYCSSSSTGSVGTDSESSPDNDNALLDKQPARERIAHLPSYQHHAISTLTAEIEWLLRDEIATALLDFSPPTEETLNFVARHVAESSGKTSCHFDKVPLHFVLSSPGNTPKFMEELIKMQIDRYTIRRLEEFLYFVKDDKIMHEHAGRTDNCELNERDDEEKTEKSSAIPDLDDSDGLQDANSRTSRQDSGENPGCQSEISSIGERPGTDGYDDGYEGDSSNSDDCYWLTDLDKRRESLPNFWLILQVRKNHVDVYFHCRFLEIASSEVDRYRQVQKLVVSQIASICRRVNQYLLLESLNNTRNCDPLLEPESHEDHVWRADSNGSSAITKHNESGINMVPGMFRCSVVWEETFCLHPRLKTGQGRSVLSRGIKALQVVLNHLSVNNRNNMFVYRESTSNVFYLRLHEQTSDGKSLQNKLSESDERLMVSRSNSVASLSQTRMSHPLDQSKIDDTRPRVRSFGEKDSDYMNKSDDSIVLMVHGISEPGLEIRRDLVQALHNRLDDAVLEVLSVMLARNPMCKLTPADVHFIQKPYRSPESYVQFSTQPYYLKHIDALAYYLRQNILQFLYIPKYTDPRAYYHLQDYSQPEGSKKRVPETDIFLNNQANQNQSSGNKGIACIAMAVDREISLENHTEFPALLRIKDFANVVSTTDYEGKTRSDSLPDVPIEFRIWKQGRVNVDTLKEKLRAAIKHSIWDLVTEYYLFRIPLTVPFGEKKSEVNRQNSEEKIESLKPQVHPKISEGNKLNSFELGEEGKLHEIYHKTLPCWFQFALDMGVSSVKKYVVNIHHRHPISTTVRELQNLIRVNAPDTTTRAFVLRQRQPFLINDTIASEILLPFKQLDSNYDNSENSSNDFSTKKTKHDSKDNNVFKYDHDDDEEIIYVPCEFNTDDPKTYSKAFIVARNFSQWKASFNENPEPELLMPKDQKLFQKFNPLIQESNFIPRQRILLAKVQGDQFILYMYNWSKERSEKLIKQATNLGAWLSSRSLLYSNVFMQKLGIFHHRPIDSYRGRDEHGLQYCQITDIETVIKFPVSNLEMNEWARSGNRLASGRNVHYSWDRMTGQVMRDSRPSGHYPPNTTDPVVKAVYDLQDLHQRERKSKEDLTRLYTMWQSRSAVPNSVVPISLANLNTFKQYSRLIHFCHTPILFLPQWRLQSAATRDHSLTPPSSMSPTSSQPPQQTSDTSFKKIGTVKENSDTVWHQELCALMMSEYKQYLQVVENGFCEVQIDSGVTNQKNPNEDQSQKICYLKKSMLGGILLFELKFVEPFFTAKLHVIECNRLQSKSSLVNQFMLSFVDACEKIKINMHLHSFMYDFHLRCIHSYISGSGQWTLEQGYHLTHFLDDFIKYYSKAPNFARNLVYSDVITVNNLTTPAHTLYSYLLSHEKTYGMQVFGMANDSLDARDSEYVLVRLQSTPLVSYTDAQDTKYTDDFTVILIVSKQDLSPQIEKSEIMLKYYLILTSKRELYPKKELENSKLGKFRTVYSVARTTSGSHVENFLESTPTTSTPSSDRSSRDETNVDYEFSESNSTSTVQTRRDSKIDEDKDVVGPVLAPTPPPVPDSPLMPSTTRGITSSEITSPHLFQIRQESVNYLGYYSSHEQLMQQQIISQARAARQHISSMIDRGMLHCRTHLLWNKLLESKSTMTYTEFMELRSLARVDPLSSLDPRLSPFGNQPLAWYQTLAKVLQNKYQEHHKQFSTADGNVTHHLILHPSYLQAFMMLTIDLHTSRGELYAVYRKSGEITSTPFSVSEIHSLIEGFVNACCFHLWMGLYSQ
ncbi:KICSTOR complex protein SZT2-like [Chelonus insularis]|uniref:KICSTOR complex protein SZT2-like n=1 Tax=Chelonus insularis TaxID=460826 RepID=UPI00158E3E0F|nr:KICSTOR complex protein SZT2-like [Chelonus insularis]